MKKNLLLSSLILSGSMALNAQINFSRPAVAQPNMNNLQQSGTETRPVAAQSEKSVVCNDQVTYTQDGITAVDEVQIGGVEGWNSAMQVYPVFTGQVTSVELKAHSLSGTTIPLQVSIHALDASGFPTGAPIGSVNVNIGTTTAQYTATYSTPVNVTNGFAIALWDPNGVLTDSIGIYINPDGTSSGDDHSFLFHSSTGILSILNDFGAALDIPAMPGIRFNHADPNMTATTATTLCENANAGVLVSGTGLPHYNHPIYNPEGLDYTVNFGDGSAAFTTASASHPYATAGSYTATGTTTYVGWEAECTSNSSSVSFTIDPEPISFFSFDATGLSVQFNSLSTGATGYSWNFGDGGNAASPSPIHNYAADGTYTVELTVTGPCGSDLYFKNITIAAGQNGGDVGVEEHDGMHFSIAPNPSSDVVNVNFEMNEASDVIIALISADGKKIAEKNSQYATTGSISFDLTGLQAGIYYLDIVAGSKKINRQVIKL